MRRVPRDISEPLGQLASEGRRCWCTRSCSRDGELSLVRRDSRSTDGLLDLVEV